MTQGEKSVSIIGAGITGLATALIFSGAGIKVRLFDQKEPLSQTSDNSLRVIHGGLRYLQTLDFLRSIRSIRSQREFFSRFPEHVGILPCLMPCKPGGLKSRIPLSFAIRFYNILYRLTSGRPHKGAVLSGSEASALAPILREFAPLPAALFWKDMFIASPEGVKHQILLALEKSGCEFYFESPVNKVTREENKWEIHYGKKGLIGSDIVIECTGPWLGKTIEGSPAPKIKLLKAFNLVLSQSIETKHGIGFFGQERAYFLVPRGNISVIGTWYSDRLVDYPSPFSVTEDEKQQAISEIIESFPALSASVDNVTGIDLGFLPAEEKSGMPQVRASEQIFFSRNYFSVLSTKYTTAFEVARRLLRRVNSL